MTGQAGLRYAFARVQRGEEAVTDHLQRLGERHPDDHEIHHVARDLSTWSRDNLDQIAAVAADHDIRFDHQGAHPVPIRYLRETVSTLTGRRPEPGLRLLEDLRDLCLAATEVSLAWEMLAQHAQAGHEEDILELAGRCHPQTLRQIRWCNTMLKTLSPQVLTSL
jgi:hypothetical protein